MGLAEALLRTRLGEARSASRAQWDEIARLQQEAIEREAEVARLRALAEKVVSAQAIYAYAEPNFGVLLSLKEEARAALARPAGDQR